MILNSQSADLVRQNAMRLARCVRSKEDLVEFATSGTYEQLIFAIEGILTNTDMYFDDEFLAQLEDANWRSFKSILLVYTLNMVNRSLWQNTSAMQRDVFQDFPHPTM